MAVKASVRPGSASVCLVVESGGRRCASAAGGGAAPPRPAPPFWPGGDATAWSRRLLRGWRTRVLGARRGGEFANPSQQPAATPSPSPSGQKGGAGRWHAPQPPPAAEAASPAAGFHHQADAGAARPHARLHRHRRLDPAVRRQGRAAGRYRLYLLSARRRRSRKPAGDVSVQWRPGRVFGLAAVRRRRPLALSIIGEGAVSSATPDLLPNAETWLDFTDLVFIDPVGTGYSRFVASGEDARKRFYSVDGDVSADRAGDPALAGKIRPPAVAEIRHRRKLWRHPRPEDRAQSADPAGRRRARADHGFTPVRLPRLFRLEPAAIHVHAAEHGGGGARSQGTGDARRSRRRRTLRARRVSRRPHQGAGRQRGNDPACRQGGRADRHRSGGEPQAGRAFRGRRIPPGIRPPQRPRDGTLRRLGLRLRSLSGFELLRFSAIPPAIP